MGIYVRGPGIYIKRTSHLLLLIKSLLSIENNGMRTQMVIRLQASTEKGHSNSKAMKIAAETEGVESVTLAGKDRTLLVVIGDGVDCNDLTTKLRKKVGHADVVELHTLNDKGGGAGGGYYYENRASPDYGNNYGYPPVASYAPTQHEYYNGYRPAYENYNYNPPPYGATVVHHHDYYPVDDQNGCSIMRRSTKQNHEEGDHNPDAWEDREGTGEGHESGSWGVESVTLAGGNKSLLLVIGDGVDPNKLTKKLREKVGEADMVELRTLDSFEASPFPSPTPLGARGTTMMSKEMMTAARSSPYQHHNNHHHQQLWQYSYSPAPSPYAYHHYPSPMGGYGYGYGPGNGVSSYSLAVARSHPANYSPLVEKHDYQPMDKDQSSPTTKSTSTSTTTMAVPRRESDGTNCCVII
ncbi:hypothetical protein QOZ80_2BG0191060 [Eleusine coracana subsp. coracana]|nr:hypothetical protein QOZ80_2BG0191060 [Eleusine coracana subsp. coracana]